VPAPVPEPSSAPQPQPEAKPAPEPPPAPEPEPPAPELPGPATVVFDVGKTKLDQAAKDELAYTIAMLSANPELRVELAGHADARGPDITNYKLGLRRARAVQAHLVRNGVDKDRITAYSAGERRPVSRADDEEAFRLNRRVEVTIYQEEDR
jgi:outer membrane protein OmpA-like peptidoglycan-associated protein